MEPLLSGSYTAGDSTLYLLLHALAVTENIYLEPSALAGAFGLIQLFKTGSGQENLTNHNLQDKMKDATHIIWATGGSMVPKEVMDEYFKIWSDLLIKQI